MTVLKRVSAAEMKRRTGLGKALGYTFPEEDEILIRKDLPKDVEKEVLAHEEEHLAKGEEGPFIGALIGGALGLLGAKKQSDSGKDAARIAAAGSERDLEFQRESRDLAREDQAPYREAGYEALDALRSLTGLGTPGVSRAAPGNTLGVLGYNSGPAQAFRNGRISQFDLTNSRGPGRAFRSAYTHQRASGGPMGGRALYAVNEYGPENIYADGGMTRNPNPQIIDGKTGYVEPHVEGRAGGGPMGSYGWGGPNRIPTGGLKGPNTTAVNPQTGYPRENPGGVEGGYQFQSEPGYQFRFEEGQRTLDRGAAARGGLLSGGYGRKAIRYGQGFASNEFSNVYNRIASIAGVGQTSATTSGNAALMGGQGMGNAASNAANASAYGQIQSGNAWANAGNQIAQLPWDQVNWPWQKKSTSSGIR